MRLATKFIVLVLVFQIILVYQAFCDEVSIEQLNKQLYSDKKVEVAKAVYLLGERGEEARRAVPRLTELLASEDIVYRWAWTDDKANFVERGSKGYNAHPIAELAVNTLSKLPSDPAQLLKKIKETNSTEFKIYGLKLLGFWVAHDVISGCPASEDLISYILLTLGKSVQLRGKEYEIFTSAASVIGKTKDRALVSPIIELYREQRSINAPLWKYRRTSLILALGDLGYKEATSLFVEELSRLESYIKESGIDGMSLARAVILSLDKLKDQDSVDAVSDFLKHFDFYVKMDADLDKWPESWWGSVLSQTYTHRWVDIHRRAISLAGELKANEAVPSIISFLDRREVRKTSAHALVKIGDVRAIDSLLKVIEMTRSDVNFEQLATLKKERSFSKLEPLLSCVQDYEPDLGLQMPTDVAEQLKRERAARTTLEAPCKTPSDMKE